MDRARTTAGLLFVCAAMLVPALARAEEADPGWRSDLGLSAGLFSGTGIRFARRFPEGIRVGLGAGYLEPADPGGLGSRFASLGTEVAVDLTHGRVVRFLGIAGLGWILASDFDPDGDGIQEDVEMVVLGVGVGMEVLYYRNLSLTLHLLAGVDLVSAGPTGSPELTLSYGF